MMNLYHPPLLPMPDIPVINHYGAFGVKRKYDVHTGVDLYASDGSVVYAVEDGEVKVIRPFTGASAGCDFWEDTQALDIEGNLGSITYGEVTPEPNIKEGDRVIAGQPIARVKRVLKVDKGKPMSMLHFAIHSHGWHYLYRDQIQKGVESRYSIQIDPTMLLIQLKFKADLERSVGIRDGGGWLSTTQ